MLLSTETAQYLFLYTLFGLLLAEGARWRMRARGKSFGAPAYALTFVMWPVPVVINLLYLFWPFRISTIKK